MAPLRPAARLGARLLGLLGLVVIPLVACGGPANPGPCQALRVGDAECALADRSFLLHVPPSYTGTEPVALVLDLHGWLDTAGTQRGKSGWLAKSDAEGFVVAWPQGVGNAWNAQGFCCDFLSIQQDVAFLESVVAALSAAGNIDLEQVYATGHSNGGSMAHTLACESADVFAGVAPVSFPLAGGSHGDIVASCQPALGIPVVHFHGTNDLTVLYDLGTYTFDALSAPASLDAWAEIQGCDPTSSLAAVSANLSCETHEGCTDSVAVSLCTVQGGRHNEIYGDVQGTTIPDEAWAFWQSFL